jgi:diaminopimelate decarboxylase
MKTSNLQHYSPQMLFGVSNPHLMVGNKRLIDIVTQHKHTPLYIYSSELIQGKVEHLRANLPPQIHLHYAIKANPMPDVVNFTAKLVDGLDIASGCELKVALASATHASDISFAGPGKSEWELKDAIQAGITINIESETEFNRTIEIGNSISLTPKVALRINPDFELKTSGMKMSGGPKPFGVDAEIAPDLLRKIALSNADFVGFHIYSGSQNLKPEAIIESQTKTFALAKYLTEQSGMPTKKLNIGGGFGIPYFPGDAPLDLTTINNNLLKLLKDYENVFSETEIIIELGRYLVGEAGIYVCKVIDKKVSRGTTYLITDGGLHHHLAASGNFGQVVRKNYPVTIGNKINKPTTKVSVVGPLCTPLDILANNMDLPEAEIGDLVVVFQSGAYGYTASPLNFLSHPEPKQVFI